MFSGFKGTLFPKVFFFLFFFFYYSWCTTSCPFLLSSEVTQSHTHTLFSHYPPSRSVTRAWIWFPGLYSRTSLRIHSLNVIVGICQPQTPSPAQPPPPEPPSLVPITGHRLARCFPLPGSTLSWGGPPARPHGGKRQQHPDPPAEHK